ncbi:metal ABC transporter permease [Acidilutibacter cellobiosedens]|jgi:zinc transport system permease protein|uniref:Metal ABC transporter permease n=1 Tax=Acidilutibacter cellobiosedens TaxID=2507161 RepID=A0A410QHR0_9FIRM|nr:metal ABC transporter permease [Acidilutibacter cellobiosedens]QAT63506.1 metal ABC transporter permease [Acidilutibacter cellobiosedens]
MQRAFIVGILISVITPCIGVIVVLKRMSMIGDALSHSSLAGVTAGLAFGINPIASAVIFSIMSAFGMERIRKSFPRYSEISIAVITSMGVGIAGILSGFVKNAASLNSFLFGSIVAITDFELFMVIGLSVLVIFVFILLYKELFYTTFDEESAKFSGVPVKSINFVFTLLTAITISISSRAVGTLVISSLIVLPVASAMQITKSYKQTVILSIIFAVFSTISGLYISYYANFKPGGTIVLIGIAILIIVIFYKDVLKYIFLKKHTKSNN